MKNNLLIGLVLMANATVFAGDNFVRLDNLGLRLGSQAIKALEQYASSMSKSHKLQAASIEVTGMATSGEDVKSLSVNFNIRNNKIKDKNADGAFLFCEGVLVPEEQESDPSDILWTLKDEGCEV